MRTVLVILATCLSALCFSDPLYRIYPEGEISLLKTIDQYQAWWDELHNPYNLTGFIGKSAALYRPQGNTFIHCGTIEKLATRTRGYLFKIGDEVQSTLHSFLLSSGTLLDSIKQYEVRDSANCTLGYIEGVFYTDAPAEFHFYHATRERFATAILDKSYTTLTINSPDQHPLMLCSKTFNYTGAPRSENCYLVYYWEVTQVADTALDERFLVPFLSFIAEVWWDKPQWFNF